MADRLCGIGPEMHWNKRAERANTERLRLAKRFVLDADATRHIGRIVRDAPRILADAHDFAIPPFNDMWVEFPFRTLFAIVNHMDEETAELPRMVSNSLGTYEVTKGSVDMQMGFLISGGHHVALAVASAGNKAPTWSPLTYLLHRPWPREEELEFRSRFFFSGLTLDEFLWGAAVSTLRDTFGGREAMSLLRASHTVRAVDFEDPRIKAIPEGTMTRLIQEHAGDLRNIIAILLFLNRTRDIQTIREVGATQGFIGNKLRPYLKHSVITLSVDPQPLLRRLCAGEGAWRRLHDVRGHFCHNRRARESGCMHPDWEETEENRQWKCVACGGLRWWRHEHQRGHEEKGLVTSEYRVTD